jgi:LPXTG-motif cell wall-anchored protein
VTARNHDYSSGGSTVTRTAKVGAATIAAGTIAITAALLTGTAEAHTPNITAECTQATSYVTVALRDYNTGGTNTVRVVIDGTTVADNTFGSTYTPVPWDGLDPAVTHTWSVKVDAWDDPGGNGWDVDQSGTIDACAAPTSPPTTASPTTAPPTTPPATTPPATTAPPTTVPPTTTAPPTTTLPPPPVPPTKPTPSTPPTTAPAPTSSVPAPTTSAPKPPTTTAVPPPSRVPSVHPYPTQRPTSTASQTPVPYVPVDYSGGLPNTGSSPLPLIVAGAGLVGLGGLLIRSGRSRTTS